MDGRDGDGRRPFTGKGAEGVEGAPVTAAARLDSLDSGAAIALAPPRPDSSATRSCGWDARASTGIGEAG